MDDKQIIKTLECCGLMSGDCENCPSKYRRRSDCVCVLTRDAIELINCQQAEIERLKTDARACVKEVCKSHQIDRNKAIKEFAEKLKDVFVTIDGTFECWEVEEHIDDLVNEMFGISEQAKGE